MSTLASCRENSENTTKPTNHHPTNPYRRSPPTIPANHLRPSPRTQSPPAPIPIFVRFETSSTSALSFLGVLGNKFPVHSALHAGRFKTRLALTPRGISPFPGLHVPAVWNYIVLFISDMQLGHTVSVKWNEKRSLLRTRKVLCWRIEKVEYGAVPHTCRRRNWVWIHAMLPTVSRCMYTIDRWENLWISRPLLISRHLAESTGSELDPTYSRVEW